GRSHPREHHGAETMTVRHSVWQSFRFAGRGLQEAVWSQRNMRVHVALAALATVMAVWLDLPAAETVALVIAMAVVLAAELLNSAVETLVDLVVGERYHVLAGRAKDLGAAAVLVTAAGAAIVGLLVLGRRVVGGLSGGLVDALLLGRAGALLLVLVLVVVVLRRPDRQPAHHGGSE
ncbi:MAG TPA: diacylglycerol kinase family protein, partial [Roseiflexaceae bacterium]